MPKPISGGDSSGPHRTEIEPPELHREFPVRKEPLELGLPPGPERTGGATYGDPLAKSGAADARAMGPNHPVLLQHQRVSLDPKRLLPLTQDLVERLKRNAGPYLARYSDGGREFLFLGARHGTSLVTRRFSRKCARAVTNRWIFWAFIFFARSSNGEDRSKIPRNGSNMTQGSC